MVGIFWMLLSHAISYFGKIFLQRCRGDDGGGRKRIKFLSCKAKTPHNSMNL
jgi:hypothetical protein